jgi:hypothetical protein
MDLIVSLSSHILVLANLTLVLKHQHLLCFNKHTLVVALVHLTQNWPLGLEIKARARRAGSGSQHLGSAQTGSTLRTSPSRACFCGSWKVKGKCALRPFLSILVIECQHKCLNVNLCPWMNKVQIKSKGMFLSLSTLVLCTNILV